MGKPVTVDSDDLETLLFTTGVVKQVEAAIAGQARDPLAFAAQPKLTAAHERVTATWRRALREPPPAPLPGDIAELHRLFMQDGGLTYEAVANHYPQRLAQTLQLVEAGPIWDGIKIDWPAPATPEFRPAPSDPRNLRYAVRLMPRGEEALRQAAPLGIEGE
jgi:hypothetical protein